MAAHQGGDLKVADALYRKVLQREPENAEALNLLGVVHYQNRQYDDAVRLIRRAINKNPAKGDYYTNLSLALRDSEQFAEALVAATRATELRPDFAEAHANRGLALMALRRPENAVVSFQRAIALKPGVAGFHNNLGNALSRLERHDEAEVAYRAAIALSPRHMHALFGLAITLDELDRPEEALEAFRRVTELDPDHSEALARIGELLLAAGRVEEGTAHARQALAADPTDLRALFYNVFYQNYLDDASGEDILVAARSYATAIVKKAPAPRPLTNSAEPDRPLRIGFLSGDLHDDHPVGTFTRSTFANFDRQQFQLYAYDTAKATRPMRDLFDGWRNAYQMQGGPIAHLIRRDRIDILIDLAGYTSNCRPLTIAEKPAPLIVEWLGYSGSSGSPRVDYIVGDRWVTPPGSEHLYSETVLRLPDSYLCWTPPTEDIRVVPLPALEQGYITFGSFNNSPKLSRSTAATWARVLAAVPNSRLLLKSFRKAGPEVVARIEDAFRAEGVDLGRLEIADRAPDRMSHLSQYNRVDIALDTFPYNGTTTTVEALWMGVPVLTVEGGRFIARVSESILRSAGFDDWVAADLDDYVRTAADRAADVAGLARLRAGLRNQLVTSPICDAPRFAAGLQRALREAWQTWCRQQAGGSAR